MKYAHVDVESIRLNKFRKPTETRYSSHKNINQPYDEINEIILKNL